MPGIINNLTGFVLTSHTVIPEIKFTPAIGSDAILKWRRNVETRVYEVHVADDAIVPSLPVNPGGLSPVGWAASGPWSWSLKWVCESMELVRGYGEPLSGIYREVWTFHSEWVKDKEE